MMNVDYGVWFCIKNSSCGPSVRGPQLSSPLRGCTFFQAAFFYKKRKKRKRHLEKFPVAPWIIVYRLCSWLCECKSLTTVVVLHQYQFLQTQMQYLSVAHWQIPCSTSLIDPHAPVKALFNLQAFFPQVWDKRQIQELCWEHEDSESEYGAYLFYGIYM